MKRTILYGLSLLILASAGTSWSAPPRKADDAARRDSATIATERRVFELESEVRSLRSDLEAQKHARDVSSQSFGHQLQLLALTLVVVLAANYLGVFLRLQYLVAKLGRQLGKGLKEALVKWEKDFKGALEAKFNAEAESLNARFRALQGDIARAYAKTHANTPDVSWIWSLRAAGHYDDPEFVAIMINDAADALRKVTPTSKDVIEGVLGEAQGILAGLDVNQYGVQKKIILAELERVYKGDWGSTAPSGG